MKKLIAIVLTLVLALSFAACAQPEAAPAELVKVKVGASVTPHAEILNAVKDELKAAGYDLEVVEFTDYVLPNTALEQGDLDANYFQHTPYLENFNEEKGTHLVAVGKVHYEPFGIYAGKTSALSPTAAPSPYPTTAQTKPARCFCWRLRASSSSRRASPLPLPCWI